MVTEIILKCLSSLLRELAERIDAGNSNLNEEEAVELLEVVRHYSDREEYIRKYEACRYLNISRSTFDAYVKDGKLPKGKKRIGFKELAWTKKELDKYVHKLKSNNN